jgi:hypothetical protein
MRMEVQTLHITCSVFRFQLHIHVYPRSQTSFFFAFFFGEECPDRRKSRAQLRHKYAVLTNFKMQHNKPVHLKYVDIMPLSLSPQFSTHRKSKQIPTGMIYEDVEMVHTVSRHPSIFTVWSRLYIHTGQTGQDMQGIIFSILLR